jgi:hypothetical protein
MQVGQMLPLRVRNQARSTSWNWNDTVPSASPSATSLNSCERAQPADEVPAHCITTSPISTQPAPAGSSW